MCCCRLQVADRLKARGGAQAGSDDEDDIQGGFGRSGRWKRRMRGSKSATAPRKKLTATVRRRMDAKDQARSAAKHGTRSCHGTLVLWAEG